MKVTPLDLRQQRFNTVMRGYDRAEVGAFLADAAEEYENALRENDRLRADASRLLVDVALAAAVDVYVVPTVTFVYPDGDVDENTPLSESSAPRVRPRGRTRGCSIRRLRSRHCIAARVARRSRHP